MQSPGTNGFFGPRLGLADYPATLLKALGELFGKAGSNRMVHKKSTDQKIKAYVAKYIVRTGNIRIRRT